MRFPGSVIDSIGVKLRSYQFVARRPLDPDAKHQAKA